MRKLYEERQRATVAKQLLSGVGSNTTNASPNSPVTTVLNSLPISMTTTGARTL